MKNLSNCAICNQIIGIREGDLLDQLLGNGYPYVRRVALDCGEFAVIPSVGPLTVGHVLLCPKRHYSSFARIPASYDEEYLKMKRLLTTLLMTIFKEPVHIFEHGMDAQCSRIVCSVEHAHQHFVPSKVDIQSSLNNGIVWSPASPDISELRKVIGEREYLFYEEPGREPIVAFADNQHFESQFIRKLFAQALNKPDKWDWRQYPFPSDIVSTFNLLREFTQTNDLTLP